MGYEMTPTDLLADRLGISEEAVALARSSPFVDLHIDSFIWSATTSTRATPASSPAGATPATSTSRAPSTRG